MMPVRGAPGEAEPAPLWEVGIIPLPLEQPPDELAWLEQALEGKSRAVLWRSLPALVVPLSYQANPRLASVSTACQATGWPVRIRRSGGGVVPLDPGVLNLTLAYPVRGPGQGGMERVYATLCGLLQQALGRLGISAQALAVAGAYCDGRFNLAVELGGEQYKLAGTAQYWRHHQGRDAVLAHATLLVETDVAHLTAQANAFEAALASGKSYQVGAMTQVAHVWRALHGRDAPAFLMQQVVQALVDCLQAPTLDPSPGCKTSSE